MQLVPQVTCDALTQFTESQILCISHAHTVRTYVCSTLQQLIPLKRKSHYYTLATHSITCAIFNRHSSFIPCQRRTFFLFSESDEIASGQTSYVTNIQEQQN